jgi:hypothetical protein
MSSRYFAPAVSDLFKITFRGKPLSKAYIGYVFDDGNDNFIDLIQDPRHDPSQGRWRVTLGPLVYDLDPAEADSKGKTGDAVTDGSLSTYVTYTLGGNTWVNAGPLIDMGQVGDYLYLVGYIKRVEAGKTPRLTYMRVIAYPPAAGEVVHGYTNAIAYWTDWNPQGPFALGVFVRGKSAFQLQIHPNQTNPTTQSAAILDIYEISIYRM